MSHQARERLRLRSRNSHWQFGQIFSRSGSGRDSSMRAERAVAVSSACGRVPERRSVAAMADLVSGEAGGGSLR